MMGFDMRYIYVPDAPGLGIEVDRDILEKYKVVK